MILVEDDEDDLMLFRRALKKAGVTYPVLWAGEGTKAIEMLSRLGPEVASVCLVSDSQLPDMSGLDLLKRVRGMALTISMKFAFLIGNTRPSIEGQAHASGTDAYFYKPCSFADLIGIARSIAQLGTSHSQQRPSGQANPRNPAGSPLWGVHSIDVGA